MRYNKPFLLTLVTVIALFFGIEKSLAVQIESIEIDGNQRIENATILSYLDLRLGDEFTQDSLNNSLKGLYATGLFADVTLAQEGSTLIIQVIENPIINEVLFEGNRKIEADELTAEISLRPRVVLTRTRVQSDLDRLYEVYRRSGRFSAQIDPKVVKLDQNRVNLVFEISEGPVTRVQAIRFVGNKRFSDKALRDEISTEETVWFNFLQSGDRYDPDRVNFDQELLRRFYQKNGYNDFSVVSAQAELSQDMTSFFLTFAVEEGERYKINSVNINSQLRNFDESVLLKEIPFEKGDWYNAEKIDAAVDNITEELGNLQFAFVTVRPDIKRNTDEATLDITFRIGEAPRVFVEKIDIKGNVRTLDKVIRREFNFVEGDPFSREELLRSERNVNNIGFFESVQINPRPGSTPDKTVVDVNVTERSTGEVSLGAGFATNEGPLVDVRVRERNLLGTGRDVLAAATIAGQRTQIDLSITEPYFLNRDLRAGFDVFHIVRDLQVESSFDQRRTGFATRLNYPLSRDLRQRLRYRLEQNEITDVDPDASLFIQLQEGNRTTSAISQRLTYDKRDSILNPTEGYVAWFETELAGIAGDARYLSGRTGGQYFTPTFREDVIFSLLGEVGGIQGIFGEEVFINERFFIGGQTLRGFERAGIGPRDLDTQDSLGGNFFYRGSAEFSFPIGFGEDQGILGHTFTDFGSLFSIDEVAGLSGVNLADEGSIRVSAGVGISWQSPFGPIRLNFALPIASEDFDEEEVFRFNFGTRF